MGKRFICCVIDMLLVALLAELIFMGVINITYASSAYKEAVATVDREIEYYENLTADTHLVEYSDGERVPSEVIVRKNICRAICLSHERFANSLYPEFVIDEGHAVTREGVHSVENDNVSYFYLKYLSQDDAVDVETDGDIFRIYKEAFGEDAGLLFTFNKEESEIPVLNPQVAYYLFHYLYVDAEDSIGKRGAEYYQAYSLAYSTMLNEAEGLVLNSEPYFSTRYLDYREAYSAQAKYINITLVISIVISAFTVLLIPKLLFKDGRTVGYRIMGLGVITADGERTPWYASLIKSVLGAIGSIPLAFLLYLFPPFNGVYEAMFVPTAVGSKLSLGLVILVITALVGIVNSFGLFTFKKQTLINLIFHDTVVDTRCIDRGESEIELQGREY